MRSLSHYWFNETKTHDIYFFSSNFFRTVLILYFLLAFTVSTLTWFLSGFITLLGKFWANMYADKILVTDFTWNPLPRKEKSCCWGENPSSKQGQSDGHNKKGIVERRQHWSKLTFCRPKEFPRRKSEEKEAA